jgi:hypothetical protein
MPDKVSPGWIRYRPAAGRAGAGRRAGRAALASVPRLRPAGRLPVMLLAVVPVAVMLIAVVVLIAVMLILPVLGVRVAA